MLNNFWFRYLFLIASFFVITICFQTSNTASIKRGIELFASKILLFDGDFAEDMSKPLPDWYKEQRELREKETRELLEKQEKILNEFKLKYELTLVEKKKRQAQAEVIKKIRDSSWLQKAFGFISGDVKEDIKSSGMKDAEWDEFWEEERKSTGFYLPGFFEVFPELKLKWPIWSKNKDGRTLKCEIDEDCQFPQACCAHPFLPGEKFCCTGFGQRVMVPAYQGQEAMASRDPNYGKGSTGRKNSNGF